MNFDFATNKKLKKKKRRKRNRETPNPDSVYDSVYDAKGMRFYSISGVQ